MKKTKLDLTLLLPHIAATDQCAQMLVTQLGSTKGVQKVHMTNTNGNAELCVHYDPNLVSLAKIQRLAEQTGTTISHRYRHETIALSGMTSADAAITLKKVLMALPGMLHAQVNYAAGLAYVAYDSEVLSRRRIEQSFHALGYTTARAAPVTAGTESHEEEPHEHHNAPRFLPHWARAHWTLLLVSLAGFFLLVGWLGETFLGLPPDAALVFYALSFLAGGYDIATHAVPGLLKGKFDTDVLMLAAASGAAILGQWPEGAFLLLLFSLGHAGEHYALDRARNAVKALGALMPKVARVKRGNQIVEEAVDALRLGDVVVVRPGDRLPVDGVVLRGTSRVDQSPITGESVPVLKQEGDKVFAGTVNQEAALEIKTTSRSQDNTLSRVMQMVAEAQSQQSPTQRFTERFTAWFVPAVLISVIGIIAIPPFLGWMTLADSFYRGMLLLVAASPCALAVGTPAAVLAGIAQAARNGVLIKGGVHLENLGAIKVVAFDKTGTLTEGKFVVTDIVPLDGTGADELLRLTAAVEQQANHPLALAIVSAAQARNLTLPAAEGLENVAGRGVRSMVAGQPLMVGALQLFRETDGHGSLREEIVARVEQLERQGKTTMLVRRDDRFIGIIAVADTPRPGVQETMRALLSLGVTKLVMLTGDNETAARRIGREAGVTDVRAGLLPGQKLEAIEALQREIGPVAMVGDGINDAPALAKATVGIAMGAAGTAVALETADVALMADDLKKLPFAVDLSRASRRIIVQNLAIALGMIGLLIVTSVAGWMALSGAVILHEGSTIVVVLNALRLLQHSHRVA